MGPSCNMPGTLIRREETQKEGDVKIHRESTRWWQRQRLGLWSSKPRAAGRRQKLGRNKRFFPSVFREERTACQHLDFRLLTYKLWELTFLLLYATSFGVLCYGRPRKRIELPSTLQHLLLERMRPLPWLQSISLPAKSVVHPAEGWVSQVFSSRSMDPLQCLLFQSLSQWKGSKAERA